MSDKEREGKSFSERLQFRAKLDSEDRWKAEARTDGRERQRERRRVKKHVHHRKRKHDKETRKKRNHGVRCSLL